MGHTPFTSADERRLVKYLVTHNSDGKGRKGNAIYQQLTTDTGRWPWSKRHPWQSWRNYYVKNDALMEKKIKIYRKKMVDESENDEEDAKQPPTKKVEGVPGSCSGERDNNRKRGRESPVLQDPNKRQKVPDKQVNMERRSSVGNGNAEPVAREDSAGSKGSGSRVSPPNESESRSSRKLDEQSVEGLLLMDHDTEERQDVHKMLKIATGSGSNISEDRNTVRQALDVSHSVTSTEVMTVNVPPHSDGSFNSLFDDVPSEPASDSEKEVTSTTRKVAKSYQPTQRDDFFRSSPETDAAVANGCDRPSANKAKTSARRQPPTLIEGPFTSTFVKRSPRIRESNESTITHSRSIEKTNLPTRERPRSPFQDSITVPAKAYRESGGDANVDAWPPIRKTLRAPSLTRETQEEQSEQRVEVVPTQKVEKKPDNKTRRRPVSLHRNDEKHPGQSVERHGRQHGDRELGRVPGVDSRRRSLPETPGHVVTSKSNIPPIDSVSISGDPHRLKLRLTGDEDKRIDLREERRKKVILRQSAGSSRSGSVANHSTSHGTRQSPSISLNLSTQDQSFVASLGIQQAIIMMSNNHGFTETVVSRILQTVNSIAKADEILRRMRVKAEEEATRQLTANMKDYSDNVSASHPKSASKERQLRISKLSDEEHLSDYSPSLKTRAGRFARLVEQGRDAEASTREARRASGTISPMKLASNTPDKSNSGANSSPSCNSVPLGVPPNAEETVFSDHRKEELEKVTDDVTDDVHELFDAHAAVADDLKKKEEGLGPLRSFHRFQLAAMFLKEVLTTQRS